MNGADGERQIEQAVTAWARTVFAAPRHLAALVTGIEHRDEVIERVAAHVVRREIYEARSATTERRSSRPRVDRAVIDPFAHTAETLRADSEYVAPCAGCNASGVMPCGPCHATGNGRCPSCHGSGKERSAKTGRPIQCKSCRATGVAPCRNCAGRGSVYCGACAGSGHQLAWLTFRDSERWEIDLPSASPLVIAHRVLGQHRVLNRAELAMVTVLEDKVRNGPLDLRELADGDRPVVRAQLARLEPRGERVVHQQYLKLAAIRRDVTFEMCGTRATLSLTGNALVGATTPAVLRPIRRRLYAWIALAVLVMLAGLGTCAAAIGTSRYFERARAGAGFLTMIAVACAVPALGAILRSWRGGLRFHPIRWPVLAWSAGAVMALASICVVGLASRPAASEVQRALAANDIAQARAVVEALEERDGATPEVRALEDRIALAEAHRASDADRLRMLDAITARKGPAAASAADEARAKRLETIRQLVATQHAAEALKMLDASFAGDTSTPIAEERARAHDVAGAACTTAACRLDEAIQATAARTTPARTAAVDRARAQAFEAIDPGRAPGQPDAGATLARLRQLRQLRDAGIAIGNVATTDAALQARAHDAVAFADAERAKVPMLSSQLDVIEELLEASSSPSGGVRSIALDEGTVYLALDRAGKCTGVYAIGDKAAERELRSRSWPAARLLSQAVGRPSALQPPSAGASTSRWFAGGAAVVARWESGKLVELRIGDATP
ncbi:MAG TPA: hypothetical protein VFT22_18150 [Kofleriaceae bacterium]|nr:hypothetical protein [Kofleriaceae bacterium]